MQIGDVLFFAGTIGSNEGGHDGAPEEEKVLSIILLQPEETESPPRKENLSFFPVLGALSTNPSKKRAPPKRSPTVVGDGINFAVVPPLSTAAMSLENGESLRRRASRRRSHAGLARFCIDVAVECQ